MIHCVCQSCNTAVEVSDNYAGTRIACKSCKAIMRVPQADSPNGASAAPKQPGVAAAPKSPPPKPAPQPQAKAPAAPQPPAKAPAAPSPAAKAPLPKPAAPAQPLVKAPPRKSPAAAPQPQAKAPAPQPKAPPEPTATLVTVEAVQFGCSQCANVLQAWPEQVGMAMNCPYCQASLTVPTPAPAAPQLLVRPAPVKSAGSQPNVPVKSSGSHPNVPVKSSGSQPQAPAAAPKALQPPAKVAVPKKAGFRFPCDKCKAPIQADHGHIGLMVVCPQCRHDMTVPVAS